MPKIPKINAQNEVIGETTIREAKENGWPRRISRIYVLNAEHSHVLLQLRSKEVVSYPNTWDQAIGGHVDVGETYLEAALREMQEEIGVTAELIEIAIGYAMPKTFDGVFKAILPMEAEFTVDPHEVAEMKWVTLEEYERDINENPQNYTLGTVKVWNDFRDKILAL